MITDRERLEAAGWHQEPQQGGGLDPIYVGVSQMTPGLIGFAPKVDPEASRALQQQMRTWRLSNTTSVTVEVAGDAAIFTGKAGSQADIETLKSMALKTETIRSVYVDKVTVAGG